MKYIVVCAVVLLGIFSGGGFAASDPMSKINRLPPSLEQKVQDFRSSLEANGYEVERGYWQLWSADECKYPLKTVGSCYGNNPTAPYVMAFLPHWKDEYVDKSLKHSLAAEQRDMTPNYRLGERDAIVVLAQLPPPARYFGIQSNVFTRQQAIDDQDPVYKLLSEAQQQDMLNILFEASPNPARTMLVASIGNSTNNVVIEQQSKENWGQQRFFVTTPDENMANEMTQSLADSAGVDANQVFIEPVSPDLVRLGYGSEADDFITYIRYSMPKDLALGEQWRKQLPLTILRVRDKEGREAKPYTIPEYEEKSANTDEPLELKGDLDNLVAAVKEYWGQDVEPAEFRSLSLWIDLIGQHCLGYDGPPVPQAPITLPRGPMNCLGDSQDADYQISANFHIDHGEVVAVVGTLGTKTGNATYTSLSANWFPALVGLLNRDDPVLEESAKKFKDKLSNPDLYTKFYVYYFARDCTGLYPWCQEVPKSLLSPGDYLKIIQRNYINPGSRRGPDPKMVLNPVSMLFDGNSRPVSE